MHNQAYHNLAIKATIILLTTILIYKLANCDINTLEMQTKNNMQVRNIWYAIENILSVHTASSMYALLETNSQF